MARPYGKERSERAEQRVVLPIRKKEVGVVPSFTKFMEEEYDGDYSAARSAYMRKYHIDPSASTAGVR